MNSDPMIHELVICANIFVKKDDKFLIINRSPLKKYLPGYIQPIGGKVEINEDYIKAARRELLEEAGVEVDNLQLRGIFQEVILEVDEIYKNNWLVFYFLGDYKSGNLIETVEGELEWKTLEEIKRGKLLDSLRSVINEILDPEKGIVFSKFAYSKDDKIVENSVEYTNI